MSITGSCLANMPEYWARTRKCHAAFRLLVKMCLPQNAVHKYSTPPVLLILRLNTLHLIHCSLFIYLFIIKFLLESIIANYHFWPYNPIKVSIIFQIGKLLINLIAKDKGSFTVNTLCTLKIFRKVIYSLFMDNLYIFSRK